MNQKTLTVAKSLIPHSTFLRRYFRRQSLWIARPCIFMMKVWDQCSGWHSILRQVATKFSIWWEKNHKTRQIENAQVLIFVSMYAHTVHILILVAERLMPLYTFDYIVLFYIVLFIEILPQHQFNLTMAKDIWELCDIFLPSVNHYPLNFFGQLKFKIA